MSESHNAPYDSPIDEVFSSWTTPEGFKRKDQASKRKCDDDSGYISTFSGTKSRYEPGNEASYGSIYSEESCSSLVKVHHSLKKRNTSSSQSEKCSSHNFSLPGVSTYSDFLNDASLYTETPESKTDFSSLCLITEEKERSSLESLEVCKTIDVNVSSSCEKLTSLHAISLPETPVTASKINTSPRKKFCKNLLKKKFKNRSLHGFEKVDFFFQLGRKFHQTLVISKILNYLPTEDIATMTMVSKTWKDICLSDRKTKARWSDYIEDRRARKENLGAPSKVKRELSSSSIDSLLSSVDSLLLNRNHSTPLHTRQTQSPPVSPSKVRFHMFQKEAKRLKDDEILMSCPRCRYPAACSPSEGLGKCQANSCQMRFCTVCKLGEHVGSNCPSLEPSTPTTPTKRSSSIGSKQSKRYLRRL